ncbi:N-acetyltransferase [Pelagibius sp. 7325]|uniref:GNAT family N-acetyltransferase n=1 Tax=Pelagibius sp. 7325 TaxID=3131994 RepID=UPI0030EBB9C1
MLTIDEEVPGETGAREALLDHAMGPERFAKTSQRLRDGRLPELALAAREGGRLVGTVRLWAISAGHGHGKGAGSLLLLGPLAVAPERQGEGIGARLMRSALNRAAATGHGGVILVGDAPYYRRFGFSAALTENLEMPGPVERHRFLGHELRPGALAEARGLVRAAGAWHPAAASFPLPLTGSAGAVSRNMTVIRQPLN